MQSIRVGVVGVGHLGRFHALNYKEVAGASLVGVMDRDKNRVNEVAAECGCEAFTSMDSLLEKVDAVSVAVPTDHHFDAVGKVLSEGKHCLVEKPMTETLSQADSLIKMAGLQDVIFQVGHIERFNPAFMALASHPLAPQFIEAHRLAPFKPRGIEVAVVLDLMIHDIDVVLSLIQSPVEKIDASGVAVVSDTIDLANARIKFSNGSVANLTASRISQKTMRKMRLFQKDAYITVDFGGNEVEIYELSPNENAAGMIMGEIGVGDRKRHVLFSKPEISGNNALREELSAFVESIQRGESVGVTAQAGREALSVALEVINQIQATSRT